MAADKLGKGELPSSTLCDWLGDCASRRVNFSPRAAAWRKNASAGERFRGQTGLRHKLIFAERQSAHPSFAKTQQRREACCDAICVSDFPFLRCAHRKRVRPRQLHCLHSNGAWTPSTRMTSHGFIQLGETRAVCGQKTQQAFLKSLGLLPRESEIWAQVPPRNRVRTWQVVKPPANPPNTALLNSLAPFRPVLSEAPIPTSPSIRLDPVEDARACCVGRLDCEALPRGVGGGDVAPGRQVC